MRPGVDADPVAQALRDERSRRYGVSIADTLSDAQKLQAARSQAAMEDALRGAFEDESPDR